MSYINDALLKAQKEKKSPYTVYEPALSAAGKKVNRPRKKILLTGILIFFLWTAGTIVWLNWSGEKKTPATVSPVQSVAPATPQVARIIIADNKNETGLKKETALARIEPGLKVKPEIADSNILYAQAVKKQQGGNLEEARDMYRKVLKIDPQNIQALNNLGVIHMNTKYYKKAIMRFNDAIKLKHDYPDAHYNLACLYAQRNDTNRSLSYLKNAIGFNPQVRNWAVSDSDLKVLADLPEFKKLLEKK